MTYDHWKTTPPDDWYGNPEPEAECDHEDYDIDILTGRAECWLCNHHWYESDAQMKARERQMREWDRLTRRWGSWWYRAWGHIRARWNRWRYPVNDEVPF